MKKLLFLILTLITLSLTTAQNIQAQSITNTVTVTWDAVTTYSDGTAIAVGTPVKYNIYRATVANLSDAIKLNPAEITSLEFVDNTLEINKTYHYFLRAYILDGVESDNSNVAVLKTLKPGKATVRITVK